MPTKSKYSAEKKIQIVEDCLSGEMSINCACKQLGVQRQTLDTWIRLYKARGIAGLIPASRRLKYPVEIKYQAVQDYLTRKESLNRICARYNISRHGLLQQWIKRYNNHGDFQEPNSGGAIYMVKGRKVSLEERIEIVSRCIAGKKDYGKTIEQYGVSYQQVYTWVKKYEAQGIEGLQDLRGRRKAPFEMSEIEKLRAQIKLKEAENRRLQMENDLLKKLAELERGRGET